MIKTKINSTTEYPLMGQAINEEGKTITFNTGNVVSEYMTPGQMLEVALAGCMYINVKRELMNRNIDYDDMSVQVSLNNENGTSDFDLTITIDAPIDEATKEEIKQIAYQNSFVRRTLTQPIFIHQK